MFLYISISNGFVNVGRLLCTVFTLVVSFQVNAQVKNTDSITAILDTSFVAFMTTELSTGAAIDLKKFIPRFYEFNNIENKFDSVSHGHGQLKIGEAVRCDSVIKKGDNILIYLSSKEKPSSGLLMPLDLIVAAKHYDREFILEFFFKASFLYNVPISKVFVFVNIVTEVETFSINLDTTNRKAEAISKYAILFNNELSLTEHIKPTWTLADIRKHATELYSTMAQYYQRAMMVFPTDVYIQYGLGTKNRKQIIQVIKSKVETYMKSHYKYLGNKFISDGNYKYTFKSLQGEISKRNNFWEYFEIGIIYTPYDETSGQFIFSFEGRYKQASPNGNGPDPQVIRSEGILLEEKYRDEVNSYLDVLSSNLKKMLRNERK